jgi:hypothetical protein
MILEDKVLDVIESKASIRDAAPQPKADAAEAGKVGEPG